MADDTAPAFSETLGQYRVGVSFNPSRDTYVHKIKIAGAALIDLIDRLPPTEGADSNALAEIARLRSIAITQIEGGLHFAVKAATKPNRI
jgi:hypothetical protein